MWRVHWVEKGVRVSAVAVFLMMWASAAFAQTDEIQVYDAQIADPGVLNLMLHNNFTPDGLKSPRFPGGLVPNGTLNGFLSGPMVLRIGLTGFVSAALQPFQQ